MTEAIYRYRFDRAVEMKEVRVLLASAISAAEDLHGAAQVRLDFVFCADDEKRTLVLDGRTEAGRTVARLLTGLLMRELDETAFTVERTGSPGDDDLLSELQPERSKQCLCVPRRLTHILMGGIKCS